MKVIVKQGANKYHKRHNREMKPRCHATARDGKEWKLWDKDRAEVWREPCQNPDCYGEGRQIYANKHKLHD